jgi:hypothetical protein
MTLEHASQLIRLIVTPSVMLTGCGVLLSGVLARYSGTNDRIRLMLGEHRALLHTFPEQEDKERLRQLDLQLPLLLRRHSMLRRAAVTMYAAILLIVLSIILMAAGLITQAPWSGDLAIVGLVLGTLVMLVGLGQVVREIKLSDDAVRLEAKRVLGAGPRAEAHPSSAWESSSAWSQTGMRS